MFFHKEIGKGYYVLHVNNVLMTVMSPTHWYSNDFGDKYYRIRTSFEQQHIWFRVFGLEVSIIYG